MPQHSRSSRVSGVGLIVGSFTANQSPANGADVSDAIAAEVVINFATMANAASSPAPSWAFKVQESDTISGGYTDVDPNDLVLPAGGAAAGGVIATATGAAGQSQVYHAGYIGKRKFINVVATAANTPGASLFGVEVVKEKRLVV